MKKKYRIVEHIDEGYYTVQSKYWWWPMYSTEEEFAAIIARNVLFFPLKFYDIEDAKDFIKKKQEQEIKTKKIKRKRFIYL